MEQTWIVSLVVLVAIATADIHLSHDCSGEDGPRFRSLPRWPDSPKMAGGSSRLKFTCTVDTATTPSFNMTWTKGGHVIKPSDHCRFSDDDQVLTIGPALSAEDQGMYACTVTNTAGQNCTYSREVIVVANTPTGLPSIVSTSPVDGIKAVSLGDSTQIRCTMTPRSMAFELVRQWFRNGTELDDTPHHTWDLVTLDNGRDDLILNITNITRDDLGEYTCVGSNSFGNDSRTIVLKQYVPPDSGGQVLTVWQIATIVVGGFVGMTLLIVVIVIKVRNRTETMEWPPLDPEKYDVPGHVLEHDVFISYSSEDEEWVKNELFKHLLDMEYNVNIDFKDFVPGMAIAENIMDSIYKSRKTIVLMSKNFLKSMWGQFELQQAHNKAIAQRNDVLILIKFDKCKVPAKLMGKTFLDWSDDDVQPHFWPRLREAIGEPVNFAEINQPPADQLPPAEDQLPVVPGGDNQNNDEENCDNSLENQRRVDDTENNKNRNDEVRVRPKKKKKKIEGIEGAMTEEEREGIRISQEERMQLIA